ncbi:hypothetical protein BQ8794_80108 [Mesorhizobium prunaredense]|uniref:Uncharacterized protein n=1 Tax=Mesorhizobium prunaredense TaxID=1631249 RepID=A0A1R3VKF8_9HYPH|nr:hypothetical protein BQ8794_80108 [Mesorhizobium prunaredense]
MAAANSSAAIRKAMSGRSELTGRRLVKRPELAVLLQAKQERSDVAVNAGDWRKPK